MTDQVERKKSYRWVSASHASYDGAGWDSSDDSISDADARDNKVSRKGTIAKLPKLPALDYSDENQHDKTTDDRQHDDATDEAASNVDFRKQDDLEVASPTIGLQRQSPQESPYQAAVLEDSHSLLETPSLANVSSRNSSRSSVHNRRTPVNEGLEHLMAQISKQMSPGVQHNDKFDKSGTFDNAALQQAVDSHLKGAEGDEEIMPSRSEAEDADEGIDVGSGKSVSTEAPENLTNQDSDEELKVSKTGYFANFIESENESEDEAFSPNLRTDNGNLTQTLAIGTETVEEGEGRLASNSNHEEEKSGSTELEENYQTPDLVPPEETVAQEHLQGDEDRGTSPIEHERKEPHPASILSDAASQLDNSLYDNYSTDDADDGLSYTDSIKFQAKNSDLESHRESSSAVDNVADESDVPREHDASDDYNVSESDGSNGSESGDEKIKESNSGYFKKMVGGTEESKQEEPPKDVPEPEKDRGEELEANHTLKEKGVADEVEDGLLSPKLRLQNHESKELTAEENDDIKSNQLGNEVREPSAHQSINLGKWRPDTSAFRNGFLEETSKKAPPGFVYDESGKLVNLTPSSMKPRIPSAYSEVESSWNAFPSEGVDDMETIKDTKTLYDTNTVFNVPGIMANNTNVPPLPNFSPPNSRNDDSDDPKSLGTTATASTLDGERGPARTHFKEVFGVQEPDSEEIARLSKQDKVPFVDINKVLNSKMTHESKLQELRDYSRRLQSYDTGLQTWLSYSLKSSSKSDRDYLFDEYKVSSHVRDAYAHADELSRKHSVINTVASVNQNMTHLTKKVISHSRKSRGIFSSIGKKKL